MFQGFYWNYVLELLSADIVKGTYNSNSRLPAARKQRLGRIEVPTVG